MVSLQPLHLFVVVTSSATEQLVVVMDNQNMKSASIVLSITRSKFQQLNNQVVRIGLTLPSLLQNFLFDLMNHNATKEKDKVDEQRKEYQEQKVLFISEKCAYENIQKRCNELQTQITHYQSRIHSLTKVQCLVYCSFSDIIGRR